MGKRRKRESPFRKILCQLMADAGMSVREAARIAGTAPSTISNWRAGASPDDHVALRKLADRLGVTLGYLLTGVPDLPSTADATENAATRTRRLDDGRVLFDGYAKILVQSLVERPD